MVKLSLFLLFINYLEKINNDTISFLLEAIEISNYKSALSQCNKLLKKQPEALILKVLIRKIFIKSSLIQYVKMLFVI
jgi:hypothetical protein